MRGSSVKDVVSGLDGNDRLFGRNGTIPSMAVPATTC